MTSVEICFTYRMPPAETTMQALDFVREVYGIRRLQFNEADRTVRVEYDATRLNAASVAALLRRTGLEIADSLSLA